MEYMESKIQKDEFNNLTNLEAQTNRIVVKKVSFVSRVFEIIIDLIYRIGKLLLWAVICLVLSIGAMAIMNPEIRGMIFNYLP